MNDPRFTHGEWFSEPDDGGYAIWDEAGVSCIARVFDGLLPDGSAGAHARLFVLSRELFAFARDYAEQSQCFCRDLAASGIAGKCRHCRAVELIERVTKGG